MNKTFTSPRSPKSSKSNRSSTKNNIESQKQFTHSMSKIRQRLCNTLDAYTLIMESQAPMRCLEHNSVISLYCETEQKLLCANCVYRNGNHKLHKVFPVEKCQKQINRDIDLMSRQAERQVEWVENSQKQIEIYFKEESKNADNAIFELAHLYQELINELNLSFERARNRILQCLDSVCFKQESLLVELQFFKDIFKRNRLPPEEKLSEMAAPSTFFYHLIGNCLLEYGKMDGKKLGTRGSEVKRIEARQIKKIKEIRAFLSEFEVGTE